MKTSIAATLLFLLLTGPASVIKNMVDAVYIPGSAIRLEGLDGNNEKIVLEYDRKTDTLVKTSGSSKPEKTEIGPHLRLFFFNALQLDQETAAKVSAQISEMLKKNGIDTSKTTPSAVFENGPAGISIGREKRFENSNELVVYKNSYLPAVLSVGNTKYLFSEYHKSVYPAAFPGKIEIYTDGTLTGTWKFYRKEYL